MLAAELGDCRRVAVLLPATSSLVRVVGIILQLSKNWAGRGLSAQKTVQ